MWKININIPTISSQWGWGWSINSIQNKTSLHIVQYTPPIANQKGSFWISEEVPLRKINFGSSTSRTITLHDWKTIRNYSTSSLNRDSFYFWWKWEYILAEYDNFWKFKIWQILSTAFLNWSVNKQSFETHQNYIYTDNDNFIDDIVISTGTNNTIQKFQRDGVWYSLWQDLKLYQWDWNNPVYVRTLSLPTETSIAKYVWAIFNDFVCVTYGVTTNSGAWIIAYRINNSLDGYDEIVRYQHRWQSTDWTYKTWLYYITTNKQIILATLTTDKYTNSDPIKWTHIITINCISGTYTTQHFNDCYDINWYISNSETISLGKKYDMSDIYGGNLWNNYYSYNITNNTITEWTEEDTIRTENEIIYWTIPFDGVTWYTILEDGIDTGSVYSTTKLILGEPNTDPDGIVCQMWYNDNIDYTIYNVDLPQWRKDIAEKWYTTENLSDFMYWADESFAHYCIINPNTKYTTLKTFFNINWGYFQFCCMLHDWYIFLVNDN